MQICRTALAWAAFLLLAGSLADGKDAVVVGTGKNFKDIITKNDFVVVEFYASWCGHCKKLAPEWEKAAKTLQKGDPPVVLVKVEATEDENKELASKYNIGGFPTIKVRTRVQARPCTLTGPAGQCTLGS